MRGGRVAKCIAPRIEKSQARIPRSHSNWWFFYYYLFICIYLEFSLKYDAAFSLTTKGADAVTNTGIFTKLSLWRYHVKTSKNILSLQGYKVKISLLK